MAVTAEVDGVPAVWISEEEIKTVFTEWDRRYREEPERFQNEVDHLLRETPETYGDACMPYFLKLLEEIREAA